MESHQHHLSRDTNLLKQLEIKQRQLEEKASISKKENQSRKFKAHPNLFHSDSDTTTNCTPRIRPKFSSSTSHVAVGRTPMYSGFQETKQRAQNFHKLLHEKLSVIDSNTTDKSDLSGMGDSYRVSQRRIGDRFQSKRGGNGSDSSTGSSSVDSEVAYSACRCRSVEIGRKPSLENSRTARNKSATRKIASETERRSRLSSQQSFFPKGIPVSVFERKFKAVVTKSLKCIAEMRTTIAKGIEPPDGEEDESRRTIRDKEFSNRFSRNYLYPLARQLKDLGALNQLNPLLMNQKLFSTYQIVFNALQALQNHLPTSLGDSTYHQLKSLMNDIVKVCEHHRSQLSEDHENYCLEFIDTFKINAELTIQKVDESVTVPRSVSTDTALKSEQSRISLTQYAGKSEGQSRNLTDKRSKKIKLNKRLSMYGANATFRKDAPWKRTVQSLAKEKINVKSKYRTATYKHRPPIHKDPKIIVIPKLKHLTPLKLSTGLKSTHVDLGMQDECIKTMVEIEDNHVEKEEWENMEKNMNASDSETGCNKEELLLRLLQLSLNPHNENPDVDNSKYHQIAEMLQLIKSDQNSEQFLKKIFVELAEKNGEVNERNIENPQLTLEIVKSHYSLSDGTRINPETPRRKEPKVTITGDKNARLICITDDNSGEEQPEDKEFIDNKVCQTEFDETVKTILKTSSETQTDIKDSINKTSKGTQKSKIAANIKISRLKKSEKHLPSFDKKQALNAIQYKLDFYRFCKSNPMYKRSTTCEPWILMSRMSEGLLNECLLTVAREIEINDIVENVFQSELQL
ncbi:uncharacterized protein LOC109536639 isoform X2 [Dendroctonus ponderosae]|uniref:uncharacterized protein LOC109536639 isoform X2 n=1 Tax=Dendroctonus ponderosae TaxID=77166 RepID=UPI00203581BB|nr:uncharacterized protein LOC109536639 isoform X2 [Dendroctonus ponderosae]